VAKAKSQKPTPTWKDAFLSILGKTSNITAAARKAKVSRSRVYQERDSDMDFAAAWDEALESAIDDAESEAWRRAVKGNIKQRHYDKDGNLLGTTREYSDTLLMFMLKSHRPERYRETVRGEFTGKDGGPIRTENTQKPDLSKLSLDELLALRQMMSKTTDGTTEPT
jgi:hypothetical protein